MAVADAGIGGTGNDGVITHIQRGEAEAAPGGRRGGGAEGRHVDAHVGLGFGQGTGGVAHPEGTGHGHKVALGGDLRRARKGGGDVWAGRNGDERDGLRAAENRLNERTDPVGVNGAGVIFEAVAVDPGTLVAVDVEHVPGVETEGR